jgi:hypothetical protein
MATPSAEEIRDDLEKKAKQRINPLLKGLTMLTGGLAGEFTGTNEQIRERNKARASLLEQQQRDLENERISARMAAKREDEIKKEIERTRPELGGYLRSRGYNLGDPDIDTLREMAAFERSKEQKQKEDEAKSTRRAQLIGALSADRGPLELLAEQQGLTTPIAELDTAALERMDAASKAAVAAKERARKGMTMQITTPRGMVYGTYDELAKKYPNEVENIMVAKPEKTKDIEPSVRATYDELGNARPLVDFPPGYPIEKQEEFLGRVRKAYGMEQGGMGGVPSAGAPKNLPKGPAAAQGAAQVSRFGGGAVAGGGRTAAPSTTAMPAQTEQPMFGPFLMEEYNRKAKQLAAESGRVPYTRSTDPLMIPMYENIARELGVQPEQIGASRLSTRPYKVVESNLNQYLGQFGQLPQDVQNQAVMDALNQAMQKRRYREQEGVMYESPFNK